MTDSFPPDDDSVVDFLDFADCDEGGLASGSLVGGGVGDFCGGGGVGLLGSSENKQTVI